jgi:hypothetical protein
MASLQRMVRFAGTVVPRPLMRLTPSRSSHADLRSNAAFFRRSLREDTATLFSFLAFLGIASSTAYMIYDTNANHSKGIGGYAK